MDDPGESCVRQSVNADGADAHVEGSCLLDGAWGDNRQRCCGSCTDTRRKRAGSGKESDDSQKRK
jgi:hypothetical protein